MQDFPIMLQGFLKVTLLVEFHGNAVGCCHLNLEEDGVLQIHAEW